jgi:hypothetical protein
MVWGTSRTLCVLELSISQTKVKEKGTLKNDRSLLDFKNLNIVFKIANSIIFSLKLARNQ